DGVWGRPRAGGTSPAIARSSVVLPAPFGPRSSVRPGGSSSETFRSTGRSSRTTVASWSDAEGGTRRNSRGDRPRRVVRARATGDRPGRARSAGLSRPKLRVLPRGQPAELLPPGRPAARTCRNGRRNPPAGGDGGRVPPAVCDGPGRICRPRLPGFNAQRARRAYLQGGFGRSSGVLTVVTVSGDVA